MRAIFESKIMLVLMTAALAVIIAWHMPSALSGVAVVSCSMAIAFFTLAIESATYPRCKRLWAASSVNLAIFLCSMIAHTIISPGMVTHRQLRALIGRLVN